MQDVRALNEVVARESAFVDELLSEVGNVIVQRQQEGRLVDIPYDVTFAFAFHAFRPNSPIHK